ncbi:MAG TPA: glycosyltransferase family 2 protein [Patescibacteria group bacterium]|nr:glycosyltransferase family 2 protein [Patescibacteria group bacterium]
MISVLIITKNEEDVIEDAVKSAKLLAEEIIVVDDSADNTPKIAEKLGAKVVKNKFKDFSDQRNLAASVAKGEWIFYLDADERLTPEIITEIKELLNLYDMTYEEMGYWVRRKTFYFGKDWKFQDRVQRFFRKEKFRGWHGIVHETPDIDGKLGTLKNPILHYTHRNLSQMIAKTNEWSEYEADLRLKAHHPRMTWWRFPRVMIPAFFGSYFGGGGYKNGTAGFIEAIYQAYSTFITYAKLWEKQKLGTRE